MVTKPKKETRPKRTRSRAVAEPAPEPSPKPDADIPLPTADTLALIAATVSKGIDLEPRLAVDHALKLWKSAREKLAGDVKEPAPVPQEPAPAPKESAPVPKHVETIQTTDGGSLPPAFPATFDEFLRLVVNGKTLADSTKRFRDFLRSNSATEAEADKRLANLAGEGFKDLKSWQVTALEYREWWESKQSPSASKAAESPEPPAGKPAESAAPPPPKTSLPTFETFLRTVVKGETDADSEKKFGAFLRSKYPESKVDELMAKLSQEGFKDVGSWLETSREYRDWSKSEKPN